MAQNALFWSEGWQHFHNLANYSFFGKSEESLKALHIQYFAYGTDIEIIQCSKMLLLKQ